MSKSAENREPPLVLVVDSDRLTLKKTSESLVANHYKVLLAAEVQEAVVHLEDQAPDLILIDARVKMSGEKESVSEFNVLDQVRKIPGIEHVPVLMVLEQDDMGLVGLASEKGATDFLTKPVDYSSLPLRVEHLLRSNQKNVELRINHSRLIKAQRIARLGTWEWDLDADTFELSGTGIELLGVDAEDCGGTFQTMLEHVHVSDRYDVDAVFNQAAKKSEAFSAEFRTVCEVDGHSLSMRVEAEPVVGEGGDCTQITGTIQDVTERSNDMRQIRDMAYYDVVTGLPNRAFLNERLHYNLALAERNESKFALLFLDLDHFKQVNDTLGHDAGDVLLTAASERLTQALRESDLVTRGSTSDHMEKHTVARLGGDEFVVLLSEINREEDAAVVARRISQLINKSFLISGQDVNITTTIGISVYPNDGNDAETLMKHADIAMYHAKEKGRNGFQFYSRKIHDQALAKFSLEKELKSAIENNELDILYQPKIVLATGEVSGVEALVRWNHKEHGSISPSEFIPLAEETGLVVPLGRWVLIEACRQLKKWCDSGVGVFSMAINCSTVQFVRSDMHALIGEALELTGIDPALLELELTESLLLSNIDEGIEILQKLKATGIQVSIDDFGTGFSSLSYLKRLPADKLKIDESFVNEMVTDKGDAAIVSAIITLSHKLGLSVVAEGVETAEQVEVLREFNCNEIQGYLVSHPLTALQFEEWVLAQNDTDFKIAS